MRRLLIHTYVSQRKKKEGKKKKKTGPRICRDESQTSSNPVRHEKEALPSGAPHASGASVSCDGLAVIRLSLFKSSPSGRPPANGITGLVPKSRFVSSVVLLRLPTVYGEGNGESLESRTDLCHGESRYGGRFCHPIRASAFVNHT